MAPTAGVTGRVHLGDILAGQAGVAGLRRVLCGQPMRRTLDLALGACLPQGSAVSCRLRRSKFKPGRKLSAYYEVTVSTREPDRRWVAVTWSLGGADMPPPATDTQARVTAEIRDRGLAAPYTRLSLNDPTHGLRLAVAPFDPAFPQLPRWCDPAYLREHVGSYQVRAVRYRPGQRHVLRLDPPDGGVTLYAKLYRTNDGARARVIGTAMAQLIRSHRDGSDVTPATFLPGDDVVVWPAVAGTPLSWWVRRNPAAVADVLREAGGLLRAVHDAPLDSVPGVAVADRAIDHEIAAIARTSAHIAALMPPVGAQVADLLSRGRDRLAALPCEPYTLVHGDFKADHLLAGPRGLTLIDFDRCAWSDPALDLAKFLADLRWLLSERRDSLDLAACRAWFLQGYGPCPPERLARMRLLEPLFLLKMAARRPRLHDPRWPALTTALVASAGRLARQPAAGEGAA